MQNSALYVAFDEFLLGYDVAESTVAKYMVRLRKPPSQTWRTFLKNHAADIVACDFFTVYTVTFRIYYVFVMLRHSDRKIVHFNVTQNPTMEWTFQQILEAFPFEATPRYLLHDNGSVFSPRFRNKLKTLGIESVRTAYRKGCTKKDSSEKWIGIQLISLLRRGLSGTPIVLQKIFLLRLRMSSKKSLNTWR